MLLDIEILRKKNFYVKHDYFETKNDVIRFGKYFLWMSFIS